jgi:hypothetical protein
MKASLLALALSFVAATANAGTLVTAPANPSDYLAVQFVPGEDTPPIKADGALTTNGYVWVEKAAPVFFTEFVGYDYPFAVHDLSAFTAGTGGVIETGWGKTLREVKYFDNDWQYILWSATAPSQGVPEPATALLGVLAIGGLAILRR